MTGTQHSLEARDLPPEEPGDSTPADVSVGDTIVYSRYGGHEITIDGEDLLVLSARDVLAVARVAAGSHTGRSHDDEPATPDALITQLRRLLHAVSQIQAEESAEHRPELLKAMMASGVDPVPHATIAQARRLARQRDRLLATGAYTIEALRELRGDAAASTTRTWLTRRRSASELFTVSHDGHTFLPAFQLDDEAQPVSSLAPVLSALTPIGLGGWAIWTWLTAASPWLGGAAPMAILDTEPARVTAAAKRFAANAS